MSQEDNATAASISVETYRYLESAAEDRARVNHTLDTLRRVAFVLGLDDLIRVDDRGALDEDSDDDRDATP